MLLDAMPYLLDCFAAKGVTQPSFFEHTPRSQQPAPGRGGDGALIPLHVPIL